MNIPITVFFHGKIKLNKLHATRSQFIRTSRRLQICARQELKQWI